MKKTIFLNLFTLLILSALSISNVSAIQKLTMGINHSCALMDNGTVKCWGNNSQGQLGNGTTSTTDENYTTASTVIGLANKITDISSGAQHTCAIDDKKSLWCWGYNFGQSIAPGGKSTISTPINSHELKANIKSVATGEFHTCILTDSNEAKCWGNNQGGLLGDGNSFVSSEPELVIHDHIKQIKSVGNQTCLIKEDNTVLCWGLNGGFRNFLEEYESTYIAAKVSGLPINDLNDLFIGSRHSCYLNDENTVTCWGADNYGQLGQADGHLHSNNNPSSAINVQALDEKIQNIAVASTPAPDHTCAVTTTGKVKCWGFNSHGQLGTGEVSSAPNSIDTPQNVVGLSNKARQVYSTLNRNCVLLTDDGVECWDNNKLGINPVKILGLEESTEEGSCSSKTGLLSSEFNLHIPSLNYGTSPDTQDLWLDLKFLGFNEDGLPIWTFKNYGSNTK